MGLTEAIRWVFRQPLLLPLTPTGVRDHLAKMGYELEKYKHVMPPIHNTLKRMKEAGEIREVEGLGGIGRAFVSEKESDAELPELPRLPKSPEFKLSGRRLFRGGQFIFGEIVNEIKRNQKTNKDEIIAAIQNVRRGWGVLRARRS